MELFTCIQLSDIRIDIYKFSGDFVGRVTPVPIPNTEVKPTGADDTAPFRCGKVGSRRIYNLEKSLLGNEQAFFRLQKTWTTFLPKAIIKLGSKSASIR